MILLRNIDLTKERKITMLLRAWNRCKARVSNQSQVVIMFCTWPKVQFRLQIRIFCVWSVLLYFPRCSFGFFLEKKLRWYHCKPRINRVFQKRVIFCSFFCHMGPPPLNFDYNQKIFRLTFQRANGLQRLRALWIRQAVLALGCAPTLSCLDPGGQVMLHHPRRVLCCRSKFLAPENLHYFSKFYGTRPTHASRFPKFFLFLTTVKLHEKNVRLYVPREKSMFFFSKSSKVRRESWCASWTAKLSIQLCRKGTERELTSESAE